MSHNPTVSPHGSNRLSLDGFSLKFIWEFSEICRENSRLIKSDKITETVHEDMCIYDNKSLNYSDNTSSDSDKNCRENQNTQFAFRKFFFRNLCRLWDDVEKHGTSKQTTNGNIIRYIQFPCRINKAKNRHSEFVIHILIPRQQWLRERALILRYT